MGRLISVCAGIILVSAQAFLAQQQEPTDPPPPQYKSNLPVDHPAIRYAEAPVSDAAARLSDQLAQGTAPLGVLPGAPGVLPALLERLRINADSQMLVFSKTSFQAARISPRQPRAIYFDDDVAVAYVPGAPTLEIAAVDPALGPVFYTMTVASAKPVIARSDKCLRCHQGPNTAGVPGLYVGSVIPGPTGAPLRDESAIVTDHRSPFADRWGGWFVTARRGEQRDRANAVASNPADPSTLVRESQQNLTSLAGRFDQSAYLAASSDIVALMTFEHQTQMTNLITRVGWEARVASAISTDQTHAAAAEMSNAGAPGANALEADIDDLVAYMLFSGEAPLAEPIEGVSTFAKTFSARGPKDSRGRSLREFDLRTRLFRYPLSYMIYAASFEALPDLVKERIYRRLYNVLTGGDRSAAYAHLSVEDRRAIFEIVTDTKKGLPEYWRAARVGRTHGSAPTREVKKANLRTGRPMCTRVHEP